MITTLAFKAAGVSFTDITHVRNGQTVKLVREPNNQFDPNAISIRIKGKHSGYVPKDLAEVLPEDLFGSFYVDKTWKDSEGEILGFRLTNKVRMSQLPKVSALYRKEA